MYQNDSFFTLSIPGQIGLAVLTIVLSLVMLLLAYRLGRGRAAWVKVLISVGLFVGFVWLSPQAYYTYYRTIIPSLPLQRVISSLPSLVSRAMHSNSSM